MYYYRKGHIAGSSGSDTTPDRVILQLCLSNTTLHRTSGRDLYVQSVSSYFKPRFDHAQLSYTCKAAKTLQHGRACSDKLGSRNMYDLSPLLEVCQIAPGITQLIVQMLDDQVFVGAPAPLQQNLQMSEFLRNVVFLGFPGFPFWSFRYCCKPSKVPSS